MCPSRLANWLLKITARSYRVPVLACLTGWAAYELKSWAVAAVLVFIGLVIDTIHLMLEQQFDMIKLLHESAGLAHNFHESTETTLADHERRLNDRGI